MSRKLFLAATLCAAQLSACSTAGNKPPDLFNTFSFGPSPPSTPDEQGIISNTSKSASLETQQDLNQISALGAPDPSAPAYVANGYNTVYRLCNKYFDSLIISQNEAQFSNDFVTTAGTASASIMAIAKSSAQAIGFAAAGTNLVSGVILSFNNRALMTPYPSETKSLILAALDAYERNAPATSAHTKLEAISLVQHYAEICTYSGITRFSKMALSSATVGSPEPQNASNLNALAQQVGLLLGDSSITSTNVADLYYYLVIKGGIWKSDPTQAKSILAILPTTEQNTLAPNGALVDPATIPGIPALIVFLKLIYGENSSFKAAVDAEAARLSTPSAPAVAAAQGPAVTVPTPPAAPAPTAAPVVPSIPPPQIIVNPSINK